MIDAESAETLAEEYEVGQDVIEELQKGKFLQLLQSEQDVKERGTGAVERRMREHGYTKFSIPVESFHYWGQRLGYDCWNDEQFVHEFLRDNPECRVRNLPRRTTIPVQKTIQDTGCRMQDGRGDGSESHPTGESRRGVKFVKNYGVI